jgi:hypothetical protein
MSWREKLRHAFAVESPTALTMTDETRVLIDDLCQGLVRRQLVAPALILLEMSRPLNYVGAQGLHALTPLLGAVVQPQKMKELAEFFEHRGSVEYVCQRLETLQRDDS